jgi:hypothetical protein
LIVPARGGLISGAKTRRDLVEILSIYDAQRHLAAALVLRRAVIIAHRLRQFRQGVG